MSWEMAEMLGIQNYPIFVLSGIILNMTPGTDTMYIIARSLSQGTKAGIFSVLGISSGGVIHTLLVAFGLSAVIMIWPLGFTILKYIGAGYLAFLGINTIIRLRKKTRETAYLTEKKSVLQIYRDGLITNITNPKVVIFFMTFLPQFITTQSNNGPMPFLLLGFTFVTTGTIWCLFIALAAGRFGEFIRKNVAVHYTLNTLTAIIFIGLAINLIMAKK
jgi:threonine/homoserine/homoserine lactone efflux protein